MNDRQLCQLPREEGRDGSCWRKRGPFWSKLRSEQTRPTIYFNDKHHGTIQFSLLFLLLRNDGDSGVPRRLICRQQNPTACSFPVGQARGGQVSILAPPINLGPNWSGVGSFVEELLSDICNLEKAPEVPRLNRGVSTKHAFNYLAYARGSKQKTTKPGSARWMLDCRQKRALRRWLRNTYNLRSLPLP